MQYRFRHLEAGRIFTHDTASAAKEFQRCGSVTRYVKLPYVIDGKGEGLKWNAMNLCRGKHQGVFVWFDDEAEVEPVQAIESDRVSVTMGDFAEYEVKVGERLVYRHANGDRCQGVAEFCRHEITRRGINLQTTVEV